MVDRMQEEQQNLKMTNLIRGKSFIRKSRTKFNANRTRSLCDLPTLATLVKIPTKNIETELPKTSTLKKWKRRLSLTSKKPQVKRILRSFSSKKLKETPILASRERMATDSSSSIVIWEEIYKKK